MKGCLWCDNPLPKRRRKYCSDECGYEYFTHKIAPLWWSNAVKVALERADNKCENCGARENLEVHHIERLEVWDARHNSPKNRQENLRVLCRFCHNRAHHGIGSHIPKEQLAFELPK